MGLTELTARFFSETLILGCTAIVASCTILLRKKIKVYVDSLVKYIVSSKKRDHHVSKQDVQIDMDIQDILTTLRNHSNCDRACLIQYQNGSTFSSRSAVWRLSCTQESPGNGIRESVSVFQHILSSSIPEILFPLWSDDLTNCNGVIKASPENCNCSTPQNCKYPKGVRLYIVDKMNQSYAKGLLQSKATKYMLATPILDENDHQIAILELDFCWQDANVDSIIKFSKELCEAAGIISIKLSQKQHRT